MYKFNGGRGAAICDNCRVMIDADIDYKEYKEIYNENGDYCHRCIKGKINSDEIRDLIDDGWRN